MPFADNDGVRIFYDLEGDGPPLVLHHPLTGTHEYWRKLGYAEVLKDKYRLILMDARGHGKSDKPHAPEMYGMEYMVGDVTAVLDDSSIDKAHFWGYSMGGRVGLATGRYAPDRFSSLIIGGSGLSEKDSKEEREELQDIIHLFERGIDVWMAFLEKGRGREMEDSRRDILQNADLDAWIAFCSYYENIGMADYLPTLTIPCLLYAGEEDTHHHSSAKTCAEILQNALFVSLPGLGHFANTSRDQVLPHVLKFLESLN